MAQALPNLVCAYCKEPFKDGQVLVLEAVQKDDRVVAEAVHAECAKVPQVATLDPKSTLGALAKSVSKLSRDPGPSGPQGPQGGEGVRGPLGPQGEIGPREIGRASCRERV